MLAPGLAMLLAGSLLGSAHFGPHDSVRVETLGEQVRVTAYGDAPFVPLLLSHEELNACVQKLESYADTACEFPERGSLTVKTSPAGFTLTFADSIKVNIVDFTIDKIAFAHAIKTLGNPS